MQFVLSSSATFRSTETHLVHRSISSERLGNRGSRSSRVRLAPEVQTLTSNERGRLPLDALRLETMASGHFCLNLSERVSWSGFEKYAEELLRNQTGTVGARPASLTVFWRSAPPRMSWAPECPGEVECI
jgi:hypothetical protein